MNTAAAATDALDLLADYERRLQAAQVTLPGGEEARDRWLGVGFRVGDDRFVAAMDEVREVIDPPRCTRVPGTAPWFLGVANVRGTLLPVMDLHGYAAGGRASASRNARVIVFQGEGVHAAFRVDDVLGMKRFYGEERSEVAPRESELAPFVEGGFRRLDEAWPVFSFARFVASPGFLEISR